MPLAITIAPSEPGQSDRVRLALAGRLDGATSPTLEAALEPVLSGNARTLILDLAELEFISSMGIRLIVISQKALAKRDGSVVLLNMTPPVRRVMAIIDALPGLQVFRDMEEMDAYLELVQHRSTDEDA